MTFVYIAVHQICVIFLYTCTQHSVFLLRVRKIMHLAPPYAAAPSPCRERNEILLYGDRSKKNLAFGIQHMMMQHGHALRSMHGIYVAFFPPHMRQPPWRCIARAYTLSKLCSGLTQTFASRALLLLLFLQVRSLFKNQSLDAKCTEGRTSLVNEIGCKMQSLETTFLFFRF